MILIRLSQSETIRAWCLKKGQMGVWGFATLKVNPSLRRPAQPGKQVQPSISRDPLLKGNSLSHVLFDLEQRLDSCFPVADRFGG